ncbi:MAG: hypothetical protein EA403_14535 [Spirochaetaceae bacterium]|nr:MAG: hypothetical protein EA403_14535 [Spirochaetaceae bacterium]
MQAEQQGRTAVQFGAGNIGRGFMGQLFFEAGYQIVFVDAVAELVDALNAAGEYPLRVLDAERGAEQNLVISGIRANHVSDHQVVHEAVAEAEVIATAVGVKYLSDIAATIASGLRLRAQRSGAPVDVYLCENLLGAAEQLRSAVAECLPEPTVRQWVDEHVGFVGTSVARMVPVLPPEVRAEQPLLVVADGYHKLPYDGPARRAPQPPIEGMYPVSDFAAEGERKLFVYNMAHAALAYLGAPLGYTWVHETFGDERAMAVFNGALDEACAGLLRARPEAFTEADLEETKADIRLRFANGMLKDTIDRVGRDPIRKLGRNDRLIGCALMCREAGIEPDNIIEICAAALGYRRAGDPDAQRLGRLMDERGAAGALSEVTGLKADHPLVETVARRCR